MQNNTQIPGDRTTLPQAFRHYVAIGDSLSEGLGDPVGGAQLKGWASYLADQLRAVSPSMQFTNLAVRGHTTSRALATQLDAALAAEPDLVSVFIGGNDVLFIPRFDAAHFADQLDRLVEPFVAPGVTVVLSTLPDLTACSLLPPPLRGALRRRVMAANEVIEDAADRHQTVLLDSWADERTRRHAMWSLDRIHPSAQGHRLIAQSVAELLGVPTDGSLQELPRESAAATVRRHGREVVWLARHAARV